MYVWRRYFIFVCCFFLPAMEQQVLLPNCRLPGFSLSLSKLIFSLYHHFLRPFGRPPRIRHEMPLLIRLKIRPFEIARSILFEFLLRSRLAPLPKERTKIFFALLFFSSLSLSLSLSPSHFLFIGGRRLPRSTCRIQFRDRDRVTKIRRTAKYGLEGESLGLSLWNRNDEKRSGQSFSGYFLLYKVHRRHNLLLLNCY